MGNRPCLPKIGKHGRLDVSVVASPPSPSSHPSIHLFIHPPLDNHLVFDLAVGGPSAYLKPFPSAFLNISSLSRPSLLPQISTLIRLLVGE